ncbi:putative fructose-bisphosphate aldolase [Lasiodiplodia theobromae]|uniref:Fructose-bisphosphate aldolase n=1 Tax=Lasiodiplodia theobromae TaxID=45133 RepID=A0A5N5DCB5_9PEZI|nr:putative fructose-bisphosphate aldolase [Lasiodiplodia theobromae]
MASWKDTNPHLQILRAAEAGRYGVLAAIAYNVEQILGLIRAANQTRSPLILQFFPWAITWSDGLLIRAAADAIKHHATVPISIHLDHAQDEALIRHAADTLPFDSIMVDMSHFEKEENLAKTRELVAYCHARKIATEAEPGRIEGGEDGVMDTEGLEGSKTTVEEAHDFVATGVDVLAPAIGNIHGEYGPAGPQLDFQRMNDLVAAVQGKVRIALHGTNGFKPELVQQLVAAGVSKINVNKLVLDDYLDHLAATAGKVPQTVLMEQGTEKVISLTAEWMRHCGSAGKA